MQVVLVVGTRPQIVKSVPIIYESLRQGLDLRIVHTGQHYDYGLSQAFVEEFSLPKPLVNLNVGSGSHASQTAKIMVRLEKHLISKSPSLVLVPGDTNSALAGALASAKLGIPVAHIEAGARCYDMKMAEEINRRLIDHCSALLFALTGNCKLNLEKESVLGEIYETGDTMYDIFLRFKDRAEKSDILDKHGLSEREYALVTLHRAENVDNPTRLKDILAAIKESGVKAVFPIHPRTRSRLKTHKISIDDSNLKTIDPVGYLEVLKLLKHAKLVLTDSGGLQKEAFWSKTPCVTIRDRTEWTETVEMGVNQITGSDPRKIAQAIRTVEKEYDEIKSRFTENPFGDGRASEKIVKILREHAR